MRHHVTLSEAAIVLMLTRAYAHTLLARKRVRYRRVLGHKVYDTAAILALRAERAADPPNKHRGRPTLASQLSSRFSAVSTAEIAAEPRVPDTRARPGRRTRNSPAVVSSVAVSASSGVIFANHSPRPTPQASAEPGGAAGRSSSRRTTTKIL